MGCNCGSNTSSASAATIQSDTIHSQMVIQDCPYTIEDINRWLDKVRCFKDKGLYITMPNITVAMLNSYIGTLLSALNYPTNICYFQPMLQDIDNFVTIVISTGQC